ncbi:hypothetical protein MUK42_12767 [Musa troglodytarum]|uniref:Uncharacterized protein n=1 Tax=Musa troglodytarum TaxID=320322 RepID=A0A9E7HM92_9LILI|nr:hypothetical protein MUK42_12767 [Musa troglodytarum]
MTEGDIDAAQSEYKAHSSVPSSRVFRLRHANTSHVSNHSLPDLILRSFFLLDDGQRTQQISSADVLRRLRRELRVMLSLDCPRMEARAAAETEGRNMGSIIQISERTNMEMRRYE